MISSTILASDTPTISGLILQPDAAEYCKSQGLLSLVELAGEIAARHFTLGGHIEVELQCDPDSDEQNPLLIVPVAATVEETSQQYRAYLREWVEQVPLNASLRIGLFPNIVGNNHEGS